MYVESEITDNSSVYDAFYNRYLEGWTEEFEAYKDNMKNISTIIETREKQVGDVYPSKQHLFDALDMTPLHNVKVVIWSPGPYKHTNAQGYAYGVPAGQPPTKTIDNIYKELKNEFPNFERPQNHDFVEWAKQGVLLMNMDLCFSMTDKDAFSNLWIRFTEIVIQIINKCVPNCIHLLWGKQCEQLESSISSREVFTTAHPSQAYRGFFGCNHFIKTNITLQRQNKRPIIWG